MSLKQCFQRREYSARKIIIKKQLDGFSLDDSFGSLTIFCAHNLFSDLMCKHNDPEDAYHLCLFEFCCAWQSDYPSYRLTTNCAHYLLICVDIFQHLPRHHNQVGISIELQCDR